MFRTLSILITAAALLISIQANAANSPFKGIATDLLEGINNAEASRITAVSGYGAPRIAVRPFKNSDTSLPASRINEFNHQILAELQRQGGSRFQYVTRDSLETLIQEIKDSGLPPRETKQRIADLRQNARADILITGQVRVENNVAILTYQAIGAETGSLFANARPRYVPVNAPEIIATSKRPQFSNRVQMTVAEAEALLWEHGYDPGPVDGVMTRKTRRALSAYQADSALPVNGRMTRRVVENLRRDTR